MTKVKIVEKSILARLAAKVLKSDTMAITFGSTVYLHNASKRDLINNTSWLRHEVAHVYQYKQHGFLPFLFLYLFESIRNGYYNNRFEVEARAKETDKEILDRVQVV